MNQILNVSNDEKDIFEKFNSTYVNVNNNSKVNATNCYVTSKIKKIDTQNRKIWS